MTDHDVSHPSLPPLARLGSALSHTMQVLLDWQQRQASRRQLLSFDERALKDIGVSRADAVREAGKLFWHK